MRAQTENLQRYRIVLPLLGEYADAGHREPRSRIIYSLRSNLRYQLIAVACSIAGLVYFFLQSGVRVTSLKALVMALAYAWGLVLAIYLMGHGLVALPRRLYKSASLSGRLLQLESHAPKLHDRLTEAIEDLEQLEGQVLLLRQRKNGTAKDFQDWIEELADTSDLPESRAAQAPSSRVLQSGIPAVITERYLAELSRKLKRARHKRIRFIEEWDRLVQDALDTQAILDAASSRKLDFGRSSPGNPWYRRLTPLTPSMRYHFHATVIPALRLLLSGFFALASICIIWSELFKSLVPQLSIVGLSVVHHPNSDTGKIGFAGQIMAACWLLYMCTAALTSLREVKVWGNRALVRRHTYAESACWYACQVAKLTVPLSYNFITFVRKEIYQDTAFYQFLGRLINLTPLGTGFSSFFPIFILVPVLATSFNLYGKLKSIAGFGVLEDDSENNPSGFGTGGWREGRVLIERQLHGRNSLRLATRDQSPHSSDGTSTAPSVDRIATSTAALSKNPRQERQRLVNSDIPQDEESEGGFFQDFAHRVRNTIDTTDSPEWIPKLKVTRPKWMGGVGGNTESSGRAKFGAGLGRWFGGRPDDGRLRL